jgi:DNA-directed RNA polymerase subunit RPC12/RpoP
MTSIKIRDKVLRICNTCGDEFSQSKLDENGLCENCSNQTEDFIR